MACISFLFLGISSVYAQTAEDYANIGRDYFKQTNFNQAIYDYSKAIEINPDYAEAYHGRGAAYLYQGSLSQALIDLNKAIEINPAFAEAYNDRGVVYGKQGKFFKAGSDFNKAIEINPNYAEAYNGRGAVFKSLGHFDQAIADYNKAIEIKPNLAEAYCNRGATYEKLNNLAHAIADFTKAIEINPNYAVAYSNRGLEYAKQAKLTRSPSDLTQSITDLDKAIEISPNYPLSYNFRGQAYAQLGKLTEAISDYSKAIELDPKYAAAYYGRAVIYVRKYNSSLAIADLNKAIEINPKFAEAHNLLGSIKDNGLSSRWKTFSILLIVFLPFLFIIFFIRVCSGFFSPLRKTVSELGGKINWKGEAVFPYKGKDIYLRYIPGTRYTSPTFKIYLFGLFGGQMLIRRKKFNDKLYQQIGLNRELRVSDGQLDERFYFECDDQGFLDRLLISPNAKSDIVDILGSYSDIEITPGKCLLTKSSVSYTSILTKENLMLAKEKLTELRKLSGPNASMFSKENLIISAEELLEFSSLIPGFGAEHPGFIGFKIKQVVLYFLGGVIILAGGVSYFWSLTYPVVDALRLWKWSSGCSVPIALIVSVVAFLMIKGFSTSSKSFMFFITTFCIGSLLIGRFGTAVYNGKYDISPVEKFDSTVISKYLTYGKNTTYYHVVLEPWRVGMRNWAVTVSENSYNTISPGITQYEILTRAGRLGFEWIISQQRIYYKR